MLTFTRTDKTSFFPNSVCFPGGGIDKTDESQDWTSFFKNHNIPSEKLRNEPGIQRPFIYDKKEGRLERELSLRLTAIRETFEELGVVFCRDPSDQSSPFSNYYHSKVCDVPEWQNKIHNHETSLMAFCEKFNVVPDVMNIYEWSCWLTPTFFRPKRYETAFFLVALNDIPPVYPESHEVQDFQVRRRSPKNYIDSVEYDRCLNAGIWQLKLISFSGQLPTKSSSRTASESFGFPHRNLQKFAVSQKSAVSTNL